MACHGLSWLFMAYVDTFSESPKVLIVSGITNGESEAKSNILDLNDNDLKCDPWQTYPGQISGATGGMLGSKVVICGGGFPVTSECRRVKPSGTIFFAEMDQKRRYASSIVVKESTLWVNL